MPNDDFPDLEPGDTGEQAEPTGQQQHGHNQYGHPQYGHPQHGYPQYGQPQYGQPGPGQNPPGFGPVPHYYVPARPYSQLSIWSIVLSCLGIFTCAITSIPGVITGHLALKRIKESGDQLDGRALAIIGLEEILTNAVEHARRELA